MNITTDYQTTPVNFGLKPNQKALERMGQKIIDATTGEIITKGGAIVTASTVLAMQNGKGAPKEPEVFNTATGLIEYTSGEHPSLDVTRLNGRTYQLFDGIPVETLKSPVMTYVRQVDASEINPNVGITLVQNESTKKSIARKITLDGTLENSMLRNNIYGIPIKFDVTQKIPYVDTPWNPGRQDVTQATIQVTYGQVGKDDYARDEYVEEYADPKTGKAPDVSTLAAQKGTEDRSFVPADIAGKQYEIVTESGERIPCNYDEMVAGVDYKIAKKGGVELKMAVPPVEVISSEGEKLPAGKLYMVDSMGHFYNGQPIKRIMSGEVTWNADMNDRVQAQIRNDIDEAIRLKSIGENAKSKELMAKAEKEMTEWVKTAQNKNNEDFLV